MATVVRKNSLLIGRNLWKNQARPFGGRVGVRGVRLGKKQTHCEREPEKRQLLRTLGISVKTGG